MVTDGGATGEYTFYPDWPHLETGRQHRLQYHTLEQMLSGADWREISNDPDLQVDEGL